jgi:bifunctional non-homologous end joining protein LigD
MANSTKKKAARQRSSPAKAAFIETMECLPVSKLPEGKEWTYEIKLDGFRLEAAKNVGKTLVYSRRRNILNEKFPYIASALGKLPNATVIDGEIVALDPQGRSNFKLLQNFRSAESRIHYFGFDILMLKGKKLIGLPLEERREILGKVLPLDDHVSLSVVDHRPVAHILKFVAKQGLEGGGEARGQYL